MKLAKERKLLLHSLKVRSHQDIAVHSDPVERWAIKGNQAADQLAGQAVVNAPLVSHLAATGRGQSGIRQKHPSARSRSCFCRGSSAIAGPETGGLGRTASTTVAGINCPSMEPRKTRLFHWLTDITVGVVGSPSRVCGYQLLTHFQRLTGVVGFRYRRPRYVQVTRHEQVPFSKLAAALSSMLKALIRFWNSPCTLAITSQLEAVFACGSVAFL